MLSCDNGAKVESEAVDKDGKKTRVMICAQGGNQVEALERASKRVADNKDIPEDVRGRSECWVQHRCSPWCLVRWRAARGRAETN